METKDTNPKDAVGIRKAPFSTVPSEVTAEVGLAMLEGARKYGRHNYRVAGVRTSVYYDAALRHLTAYWEGEDIDPDSGLSHVTKAIATLYVLRDATINDKLYDDRPPSLKKGWQTGLSKTAGEIIDRIPDAKDPYTQFGSSAGVKAKMGLIIPRWRKINENVSYVNQPQPKWWPMDVDDQPTLLDVASMNGENERKRIMESILAEGNEIFNDLLKAEKRKKRRKKKVSRDTKPNLGRYSIPELPKLRIV